MKLIFIHGSGYSREVWQQQLAHFPRSEALDLPGHGASSLSLDSVQTLGDYVDWLRSYLDQQAEPCVLVGHSLGSAIVMQLSLTPHPLLKGLVLIGAGARLKVLPDLLAQLSACSEQNQTLPESLLAMNAQVAEPFRSELDQILCTNGPAVLYHDLKLCNDFDIMNSLPRLSVPSLILVGEQDRMTPLKYAQYLLENIDNAYLEVIAEATHMVFAEQAERVNVHIETFMASL